MFGKSKQFEKQHISETITKMLLLSKFHDRLGGPIINNMAIDLSYGRSISLRIHPYTRIRCVL